MAQCIKGSCHGASNPSQSQDLHGGRGIPRLASCPLTSMGALWMRTHTHTEESGEAVPCISQTAADLRSVPTSPPTSWCMTPFSLLHDGKQAGQICLGRASIDKREFLVPASVEGWSMRHSAHDWDVHQQPSPLRNFCSKKGYIAQINFPDLVNKGPWSLSTNFQVRKHTLENSVWNDVEIRGTHPYQRDYKQARVWNSRSDVKNPPPGKDAEHLFPMKYRTEGEANKHSDIFVVYEKRLIAKIFLAKDFF